MECTTLEDEYDVADLENASTLTLTLTPTPTNPYMSSLVTPKGVMSSPEQRSSMKSTKESTIDGGPKKFRSLTGIYADTLGKELDPDKLVLITVEELTTYREVTTETEWQETMHRCGSH